MPLLTTQSGRGVNIAIVDSGIDAGHPDLKMDLLNRQAGKTVQNVLVTPNGADADTEIPPAYLPHYTQISGTSMACPRVAGVAATILEANPALTPDEVKQIIERTVTSATEDTSELRIVDFGLRIRRSPGSSIRIPQSAFRNRLSFVAKS